MFRKVKHTTGRCHPSTWTRCWSFPLPHQKLVCRRSWKVTRCVMCNLHHFIWVMTSGFYNFNTATRLRQLSFYTPGGYAHFRTSLRCQRTYPGSTGNSVWRQWSPSEFTSTCFEVLAFTQALKSVQGGCWNLVKKTFLRPVIIKAWSVVIFDPPTQPPAMERFVGTLATCLRRLGQLRVKLYSAINLLTMYLL